MVQFFGNQFHGTEEYTGRPRHVAIAYVPRGWRTLADEHLQTLKNLGFRIPEVASQSTTKQQPQASTSQHPKSDTNTRQSDITNKLSTTAPQHSTDHNSFTLSSGVGKEERVLDDEGHKEFWEDVCEAQAGVDGVQDCEVGRVCFGEIVEVSDGDDCVSLDPEDPVLSKELDAAEEETHVAQTASGTHLGRFWRPGYIEASSTTQARGLGNGMLECGYRGSVQARATGLQVHAGRCIQYFGQSFFVFRAALEITQADRESSQLQRTLSHSWDQWLKQFRK